ncbi:MAG: hypothetical protein VB122_00170, partial [Erysipelotrichales bacterium]|nr:hypothetical protein [Erysipelotrichales bacterium]
MVENKTVVPDSLLSFTTQTIFLGQLLLKYRHFHVSISAEVLGDIGIIGEAYSVIELKNARAHNPLSNKSIDFWKTMYNWTNQLVINKGKDIKFELYVHSNNELKKDFINKIENCTNDKQFKELVCFIKKELLGSNIKKKYDKDNVNYFIKKVISKEMIDYFKKVICSTKIILDRLDYINNLKSVFSQHYMIDNNQILKNNLDMYVGWVNEKIISKLQNGENAEIHTDDLNEFEFNLKPTLRKQLRFISASPEMITSELKEKEINRKPLYMRQIEIINLDPIYHSVIEYYLRLKISIDEWISNGYIKSKKDMKYTSTQNDLIERWKTERALVLIDTKYNDIEKGQQLFLNCRKIVGLQIDNEIIDPSIIYGMFHDLSDKKI